MESTVQDKLTQLIDGDKTVLEVVRELDTSGSPTGGRRLVIESRRAARKKAPTPPREHVFYDAPGFMDYVRRYGTERAVVYLDDAGLVVRALLDETKTDGVEVVQLAPKPSPRWKPWREHLGRTLPLDQFVDFLRDNRKVIVRPDGRELLLSLSQVKASTEVVLHRGRGQTALNGLLVKTAIKGGGAEDKTVDLPDAVGLFLPIYAAGEVQNLEIDIILETGSDGRTVTARLSSADIREAEIAAFEALVAALEPLRETYVVAHGVPTYGTWKLKD